MDHLVLYGIKQGGDRQKLVNFQVRAVTCQRDVVRQWDKLNRFVFKATNTL